MRRDFFTRFAIGVLAYNLLVIAWGAFVRATGSGAGCGAHWPLCNGEIVPRAPSLARVIEFSHRATSGLALVLVVALAIVAFRARPKGDPARRWAVLSVFFIFTEALVGAGLVLFELVAHDASLKRALSIVLHLTNTFILLGCLTLTARAATGAQRLRLAGQGAALWLAVPALVAVLFLGMTGAVAALGDTLFPAKSLADGFRQDLAATAHLFVKLRALHPMVATLTGVFVLALVSLAPVVRRDPQVATASKRVLLMFAAQFVMGLVNVALLAPVWMQLAHLLVADAFWIALVLLAASMLREQPTTAATTEPEIAR